MLINAQVLEAMGTTVKAGFNAGLKDTKTYWQEIAMLVPSTGAANDYPVFSEFPELREWIGDRQFKDISVGDYAIKNKTFEGSVSIKREKVEDNQLGLLPHMSKSQGYAAATHPDKLVYGLLAAGFTTECYDKQNFFDTDHPVGNADTGIVSVSNMQSGTGNPWFLLDTTRPFKPLIFQQRRKYELQTRFNLNDPNVFYKKQFEWGVDGRCNVGFGPWQLAFGSKAVLDAANFEAAKAAMGAFQSDEGRPSGITANLLVCGSSNESAAKKVVEAPNLAGGGSNTNYNSVKLLVVPWLK